MLVIFTRGRNLKDFFFSFDLLGEPSTPIPLVIVLILIGVLAGTA